MQPRPSSISLVAALGVWLLAFSLPGNEAHAGTVRGQPASRALEQAEPHVRVYAVTLTIPTYPYLDALRPTLPEEGIYPYPRLDFAALGPPASAHYKAIVLENRYLSITVLPALGGRLYRIQDRTTGRDVTYRNSVIKPTPWGVRGWWLATGGIEWCFPLEEHGLNEWRPWKYYIRQSKGQASITVHDVEDRTGMIVWVRLTLDATHSFLALEPGLHNPTASSRSFQFWLNGMLSLNQNHVSERTRFILPAASLRLHSTGDADLPGPGATIAWPDYQGRDLSLYQNWKGAMGGFASPAAQADFAGAYDEASDQGVVRIFPRLVAPGVKLFAPRGLDPGLWTDDGSSYFELWGGLTPTFGDFAVLAPGQALEWRERWYPVSNLHGAFTHADETAAARIVDSGDQIQIAIAPTQAIAGKVVLWVNGAKAAEWPASMQPGRPFQQTWNKQGAAVSEIEVIILDKYQRRITQYVTR